MLRISSKVRPILPQACKKIFILSINFSLKLCSIISFNLKPIGQKTRASFLIIPKLIITGYLLIARALQARYRNYVVITNKLSFPSNFILFLYTPQNAYESNAIITVVPLG